MGWLFLERRTQSGTLALLRKITWMGLSRYNGTKAKSLPSVCRWKTSAWKMTILSLILVLMFPEFLRRGRKRRLLKTKKVSKSYSTYVNNVGSEVEEIITILIEQI